MGGRSEGHSTARHSTARHGMAQQCQCSEIPGRNFDGALEDIPRLCQRGERGRMEIWGKPGGIVGNEGKQRKLESGDAIDPRRPGMVRVGT